MVFRFCGYYTILAGKKSIPRNGGRGALFASAWGHAALPYGGIGGRDERQSRLGAKSNMQSAVTNGADNRAHRILEVFESLRV